MLLLRGVNVRGWMSAILCKGTLSSTLLLIVVAGGLHTGACKAVAGSRCLSLDCLAAASAQTRGGVQICTIGDPVWSQRWYWLFGTRHDTVLVYWCSHPVRLCSRRIGV